MKIVTDRDIDEMRLYAVKFTVDSGQEVCNRRIGCDGAVAINFLHGSLCVKYESGEIEYVEKPTGVVTYHQPVDTCGMKIITDEVQDDEKD